MTGVEVSCSPAPGATALLLHCCCCLVICQHWPPRSNLQIWMDGSVSHQAGARGESTLHYILLHYQTGNNQHVAITTHSTSCWDGVGGYDS